MKRSIQNTQHFDKEGFSGDVYVSDEEGKGFDALKVTVNGKHPKTTVEHTRAYLVINGTGTFTIDDETHEVQPEDLYIIEQGSSYEYEGNMSLFEFNIL